MSGPAATIAAALALLGAGCLGAPAETTAASNDPIVVDDPNDFTYLAEANASERPHIHDYWGGQTQLTIAEGPMTWSGSQFATTSSTFGGTELKIPDGNTVIPGTGWVNVTATWKNERPFPVDFFIEYHTANGSQGLLKMPSGEAVSIEVAEEMNDLAHAKQTRWVFRPVVKASGAVWNAEIKAQVRVEIAKTPGPLPYAPAHHDPWGDNQTLVVFDQSGKLNEPSPAATAPNPDRPPSAPNLSPVPVETATIYFRLHYNSSTPTVFHYDPVLDFRGADRTSYNTAGKPQKREVRNTNGLLEWTIEVKPEMWDSPYATKSDWRVTVFWGGENGQTKMTHGANWMQGDYHFEVVVQRA